MALLESFYIKLEFHIPIFKLVKTFFGFIRYLIEQRPTSGDGNDCVGSGEAKRRTTPDSGTRPGHDRNGALAMHFASLPQNS